MTTGAVAPRSADVHTRRVLLSVCTYRRNEGLGRLLETLAQFGAQRYQSWALGVTVVDDSGDADARPIANAFAARFAEGVEYRVAGRGNIAHARNEALDAGLARADWIVFLDDDELPTEPWLEELFTVQGITDADIVIGVVRPRWPAGAPRWLIDSGFQRAPEFVDLSEPPLGITGNSLLRVEWLRRAGLRFDEGFGVSGGEDTVFFARARACGARIRYAARSIVYEDVLPERAKLSYQLRRELRTGQQMARIGPDLGLSNTRLVLRGVRGTLAGAFDGVRGGLARDRAAAARGLGRAVRGAGIVLGLLRFPIRHS